MDAIKDLKGLDIYLIDQMMKGRLNNSLRVLDAGCGTGRNLIPLSRDNYNISGFDPNHNCINRLKEELEDPCIVKVDSIEEFNSQYKFDFIICNAVLHFAKDHLHFNLLFKSLVNLLSSKGVLFIRMTSDIGQENMKDVGSGRFILPDKSERYLITRERIDELCKIFNLKLMDPVKSLNVDGERVMTTIVFAVK